MKLKDIHCYICPCIYFKKIYVASLFDAKILAVLIGQVNTKENAVDVSNMFLKSSSFLLA